VGKREQKRKQMAELMERWQASGLTAEAFAKREKIPVSRLWYWKRRTGRATTAPTAFVPVRILQDETRETAPTFELTFADGRRLVGPLPVSSQVVLRLSGLRFGP
jgi:hypothetical protein